MAKQFNLTIISPEKRFYAGSVVSLIVPATLGYLGVLADHIPLTANLGSGKIIIKDALGKTFTYDSQSSGFLQVLNNEATILLGSSREAATCRVIKKEEAI